MQEVQGSNPRLGGLRVSQFQVFGGISTLQSRASGLQSTTQGSPSGPKRLLRVQKQAKRSRAESNQVLVARVRCLWDFPGKSLWTWEFHALKLRFCLSQTLWNPEYWDGDWPNITTQGTPSGPQRLLWVKQKQQNTWWYRIILDDTRVRLLKWLLAHPID